MIEMVLLTALGVGVATVIGSLMGFAFKDVTHKFSDIVLSFAAGVMLAAAVFGLIEHSLMRKRIMGVAGACSLWCWVYLSVRFA